jgi:CheY-like chemotaxis protein
VLSLQLKAQGYRTVFAADALEAITRPRQAQPDAILLDLGLPGSNGFLVLEQLKATSTLAPIPVIIVSAEATAVAQAKAFAIGARPISKSQWSSARSSRRSKKRWLLHVNW